MHATKARAIGRRVASEPTTVTSLGMPNWLARIGGRGGGRAVAAAAGASLASIAAFGNQIGASPTLRAVFVALSAVSALIVVALTVGEQMAVGSRATRRRALWVQNYFSPRGRGSLGPRGEGDLFVGRDAARDEISAWLRTPRTTGSIYVVTGGPGSGKSAVLGRLVAESDQRQRRYLDPTRARAKVPYPEARIDIPIYAKGLTLAEVLAAIAAALGSGAETTDELIDTISKRASYLVIVVDALDEAGGDGEARRIAQRLLRPLAEVDGKSVVRVLVGTRRGPDNEFVRALGHGARIIDLDDDAYFDLADLSEYVYRHLLRGGDASGRSPYQGHASLARRVGAAVANRAAPSFLIAQLVSRSLVASATVVDVSEPEWWLQFPSTVGDAMEDYLDCFDSEQDRRRARSLLTALAYAEGAGFPFEATEDLWSPVACVLAERAYAREDVHWLLDTRAADLLHWTPGSPRRCRLFHQALTDHLRLPKSLQVDRQRQIAALLRERVPHHPDSTRADWSSAAAYIRDHIATHAAAGGCADALLSDIGYLVAAEPSRLLPVVTASAEPRVARGRWLYMNAVANLRGVSTVERAAYLGLSAHQTGCHGIARELMSLAFDQPWSTRWAHWQGPSAHYVVGRHHGAVKALSLGLLNGRSVALSGSDDCTLRTWDLTDGVPCGDALDGEAGWITHIALGQVHGRTLALSSSRQGDVRLWDLRDEAPIGLRWFGANGPVAFGGKHDRPVAATGSRGGRIMLWDLGDAFSPESPWLLRGADSATPAWRYTSVKHRGWIGDIALGVMSDRAVGLSSGQDHSVLLWDVEDGSLTFEFTGHEYPVGAVEIGQLEGRSVAVSGDNGGSLWVWDLASCEPYRAPIRAHPTTITSVALCTQAGRAIAVTAGFDGTIRSWDLLSGAPVGQPLRGHDGLVMSLAAHDITTGSK